MIIEKMRDATKNGILVIAVAALFAFAGGVTVVLAQDQSNPPAQDSMQQNPPDQSAAGADQNSSQTPPAVGHISMVQGSASIQRGDSGDWIAAAVNTPIEAGDRVSTGDGSRVEVQLDYADVIRLDENSTIKITNLTNSQIQVQVGQGLASYDVFGNGQADSEIDTPNAALHPLRQGEYRIEVNSDSESQMTVRDGQAEISEPQGSTRVDAGQLITIQGTDSPQYQVVDAPAADSFDKWNLDRDQQIQNASSWQHSDRYYAGAQDLDQYGHWEDVPDYGQVWVPAENSDWAPYRDGTWQWEPYYGWTWVSYEPWGWAPYHYGRWFVYGGDWVWWPGPIGAYGGWGYDPVWAPAYVSFFGWGGGFGFGVGFGSYGWLPCGPGDFYRPWWGYGGTRFGYVGFRDNGWGRGVGDRDYGRGWGPLYHGRNGFSNIGRFNNDARVRSGFSSMSRDQFGRGRVSMNQHGISAAQFHRASMMTGRLPVAPSRQSFGRAESHVSPSIARTANFNNQHFFSRRSSNSQAGQAQRTISNSRGQIGAANSSRFSPPARQQSLGDLGNSRSSSNSGSRSGWQSFSHNGTSSPQNRGSFQGQPPARQNGFSQSGRSSNSQPDAWHRFTPPSNANRQPAANGRGTQGQFRGSQGQPQPRQNNNGWHQFTQPSSRPSPRPSGPSGRPAPSYGYRNFSRSSGGNNSYRPRLDMTQPIARRPSGNSSYGRPNGGYYGRPSNNNYRQSAPRSYSQPRGGFSSRSFGGGSFSRPSGGSGYHGGGGGGHASAPRGGGSRGGGRPR
ncbi:MAG TPA: FecR family protein [Candidatus Acidoferrales bacterium]|nr:FecR family protein [Candidatus Acidoferrales bacterium]